MSSRLAVHGSLFLDDSTEIAARRIGPEGIGHISLMGDDDVLGIHLGRTPEERRRTADRLIAALTEVRTDQPRPERVGFTEWRESRASEPRCLSPICGLAMGHAVGAVGCRYGNPSVREGPGKSNSGPVGR